MEVLHDSDEEDDEKFKDETYLVAQASNEVCSESSYFSDENSSIDDLVLDNEYNKLCKIVGIKSLLEVLLLSGIQQEISLLEDMDLESTHMVAASKNGNTTPKTTVVEGVEKVIPPTTAEGKAQKSSETLDQTFDRLQKLVSQLDILGETLSQEDVNQKLLRSLSPEWNTHAVVWRNKPELVTMSMDDLYNNLKVYKPEVKGKTSSNTSTQNMAFIYVNSTNVDNVNDAMICAFFSSQPNNPQLVNEDLKQLYPDDLEEMDLR
ncbi:hypothetical protein Tco_0669617 [Tanacetum coccineum]